MKGQTEESRLTVNVEVGARPPRGEPRQGTQPLGSTTLTTAAADALGPSALGGGGLRRAGRLVRVWLRNALGLRPGIWPGLRRLDLWLGLRIGLWLGFRPAGGSGGGGPCRG